MLFPMVAGNHAAAGAAATSSNGGLPSSPSLNNMFLQLLVAQLKNQNPLSPLDPSQFVGQLAQFSELSQVTSIYQLLQQYVSGTGTASASSTPAAASTAAAGMGTGMQAGSMAAPAQPDGFSQMVQQALAKIQGGH